MTTENQARETRGTAPPEKLQNLVKYFVLKYMGFSYNCAADFDTQLAEKVKNLTEFAEIYAAERVSQPVAHLQRLREIKQRCEKATKGPWEMYVDTCARCNEDGKEGEYDITEVNAGNHARFDRKEDADFIAHSREDIPWLLEQLAADE